jgi:hypothetical protein
MNLIPHPDSRFRVSRIVVSALLLVAILLPTFRVGAVSPPKPDREPVDEPDPEYWSAIQNTAAMVWDNQALSLAEEHGLQILNVTWEDTGRYYDSAVGPNISDVTIQVQSINPETGQYELTLMPVIRYDNFTDLTADISPDEFFLLVGNERGIGLESIRLSDYLRNFRRFLSVPDSWSGNETSLLASRDTHVLVSAQAAFLPVPRNATASFNPVIFNYQSYQEDPAVLTIVATREGTSATIIDNVRDGFPAGYSWGQRLFFNHDGERASFSGERLSEFVESQRPGNTDTPLAAGQSGLNMVLIIQVPLKQKHPLEVGGYDYVEEPMAEMSASDVEAAVIGHGPVEGPFTEIDDLKIERDPRFPIRVTVQFYKATSNGVVSENDMQEIADQIERVYEDAEFVGSLVVGGPSERPTEYDGPKDEPPGWWGAFWQRFEENVDMTRENALDMLRSLDAVARRWWYELIR